MPRPQVIRARSTWIYGLLVGAALALILRLVLLQVIEAPHLSALAQQQRTRDINLASLRGEIVDRHGRELAVSVDAVSIYAQPADFTEPVPTLASKLAPVLHRSADAIAKELDGRHWHWILRQQDEEVGNAVRALRLPGIGVVRESKRVYPKETLACSLLGFTGVDNQGLAGIEHDFDHVLRGSPQKLTVQVDARGREILRASNGSPLNSIQAEGAQVVLTLDETIQHIAQRELSNAVVSLQARRGAVLVMDPQTGDVLAYALYPTFDPNHYQSYPWEVVKNWVANDVYEPGSTMKIFTISSALAGGQIDPGSVFDCGPTISVGKRTISDHEAPAGIRHLRPRDILAISSNVGALQVGLRMPPSYHRAMLERFGFGATTHSGIHGESRGQLPALPWPTMRQGSISFGYGLSVTPLQILTAATAIADEGRLHRPRLIDRVVAPDGQVLMTFPVATASQVISPAVAHTVMDMLGEVVTSGTGTAAKIPGYNVAGKTGTANKARSEGGGYTGEVIASFLGIVPAEAPRLLILALLDSPHNAHFASMTAVPLFRAVASDTLQYLGVSPSTPSLSASEPGHATH